MIQQVFRELSKRDKMEFFLHCQELLVEFHPLSQFIFRKSNFKKRIAFIKQFIDQYQGLCYWDNNVCALYNRIMVNDPKSPELIVRDNMYKPPVDHHNAIIVDFVVFRKLEDCLPLVKSEHSSSLLYVLFVKNNHVKIYPTLDFVSHLFSIPVV